MMGRWGLHGMESFEQPNVARKEGSRLNRVDKSQKGATVP
jgi:biotin synthase